MQTGRMPHGMHIAFLLVFFALLNVATVVAQPDNCSYCAPEDLTPWTIGTEQRLACVGDCVYEVNYRYRECANGYMEIAIDGFTPLTSADCSGVVIGELVRSSGIGAVLAHSHILFNIPNPDLGFFICVMMPSCMERDVNTGVIAGCTDACCRNCYNLYYDTNTEQVMINGSHVATSIGTAICTGDCNNICDAMDIDLPGPVYTPCELGCSPCGIGDPTPYTPDVMQGCVGDCELTVNFEWRICGDGYREMRMTGFCVDNAPCNIVDEERLIQAAMGLIFSRAVAVFNIQNPYTPFRVWYSQPSCMAWDATDGCFKACSDACCSNRYDLQLNGVGKVTTVGYDAVNGTWGDQNCTGTINGSPCLNRCSALELNTGEALVFDCTPHTGCAEDCYWTLEGNSGTDPSVNYLGTNDNQDLVLRTNAVERMRILSTGQVGINTTSPNPDSDLNVGAVNGTRVRIGTYSYIEDGSFNLTLNPNSITGTGDVTPGFNCVTDLGTAALRWNDFYLCGNIYTTSDMNSKTNIESLGYGLDHIMALNPVSYNLMNGDDTQRLGLLAQEVQSIIPEIVYDPKNDVKLDEEGNPIAGWQDEALMGVAYQELIPVLVKAIQEQQVRIQVLEAANGGGVRQTSVNERAAAFSEILLEQNQPNPFAEETRVAYYVPAALDGQVELLVQDVSGKEVLPRFSLQTGAPNSLLINATQLPSGVYVYGIAIDGQMIISKKLMLIR